MSDQFFLRTSGKVMGPFSWAQLQDLRKRGRLHEFHELSSDRMTWLPAGSLPELFPAPAQGASAPAPGPPPGDLQWFYADSTGERRGPVARHQLGDLIATGRLAEESLVWMKGMPDWKAAVEAVPDLFHAAPPLRGMTAARSGWQSTRVGLLLAIIAALVFAGTFIFCTIASVLVLLEATADRSLAGLIVGLGFIVLIGMGLYVAVLLLEIGAFGFCAAAPPASGTRGLAITTLCLCVGHLLAHGVYSLVGITRGGLGNNPDPVAAGVGAVLLLLLLIVSGLLLLSYRFFFLLFLRGVALACQASGLARQVTYLTILYGVLVFLFALVSLLGFLGTANEAVVLVRGLMGLLLIVVGLGWLVWYIIVLFQVRGVTGGVARRG